MVTASDSAAQFNALLAPLAEALPQTYRELSEVCNGSDVLVSGPVQPAALMVHETTGIPFVTVQNVHFTNGGTRSFQQALSELVNPFRRQLGLSALYDPIGDANRADTVLFAMSRHIRQPRKQWPNHYHMTGYFFLDQEWKPDPALVEFFASGDPPIVVTFGSMAHGNPDAMTELILSAINKVGCRAVIQHGWGELAKRTLPETVRAIGFAPHSWVFARSAVIVHHGGAGTTAAVFRSGVPSVFVPHTWDQPIWAALAKEMGCTGDIIPLTELTAERLANAISDVLCAQPYRDAAAKLGSQIGQENGVRTARLLIEELISKIGLAEEPLGLRGIVHGQNTRVPEDTSFKG
jgi:sterol 3beta-glucosyltransferase